VLSRLAKNKGADIQHYSVSLEIWKGVAFVGLLALTVAFFMPWITVSSSFSSVSSSYSSVSFSYSFVDLCSELMAKSSLAQQMFGTTYNTQNLPIDHDLDSRLRIMTTLAVVFYALSIIYAVAFLIRKSGFYLLLLSSIVAMASVVSALFAASFLKQQLVEWEQFAFLLNIRLDIGAWVTLVAGFVLAGSYVLSRQGLTGGPREVVEAEAEPMTESKPNVEPSMMFCRKCGSKILRDSRFCKECGAELA